MKTVSRVRRAMIVAPHADDETIGAWALMRRLVRHGARVDVVVVTDGAASHPNSRSWPRDRLVRERRRETRRAMAALSIRPARIRFLDLPDGRLEAMLGTVAATIAQALRRSPPPDLIVGPVTRDAHGDHRAVARALASLPRRGERRLGYQVWPERAARNAKDICIALTPQDMRLKRRLIRGYRTQSGRITDAEGGFGMTWRHLQAFVRPAERFALLP